MGATPTLFWPMGGNGTLASVAMLDGGYYTQPKTAPAATIQSYVQNPGPYVLQSTTTTGTVVNVMTGLSSCPGTIGMQYPNIPLTGTNACVQLNTPTAAKRVGPMGTTINTGFPFTTGTVFAQQTTNTGAGPDFFSVSGSDNRTPRGIGNITLVSGGLSIRRTNVGPDRSTGSIETISLTVGKQVPAMSSAGYAAAAVLMVLAAGYALRRRF
jgi:hypothetical protein